MSPNRMLCSLCLMVFLATPALAQELSVDTPAPPATFQAAQEPMDTPAPQAPLQAAQEAREAARQALETGPLSVSLQDMPVLRPGARSVAVEVLRQALSERGFLPFPSLPVPPPVWEPSRPLVADPPAAPRTEWDPLLYDDAVLQAVYAAQRHYAITEDGVAGPQLYASLSASGQAMSDALLAWADELDASAAQARAQGRSRLVVVNIPSYTLKAIDLPTGKTIVESRVIVGKPGRRTPVFTTNIVNLKYNPDWTPPPSLAAQGKRYARPGPNNPLGRVRFSTDNHLNIYLHHTNEPDLFNRKARALSSGCVRVEEWEELADFLSDKDMAHIHARVAAGRTTYEKVDTTPVAITYSLADVVEGRPALYPDVYGRNP